ncbi:ABC transporter ATP-binding protein [Alkalihalobacillus pseudalcaliphilus]|uniref:ABC transporter ATP-binding protein n=1 Tax=Alkalihalobacillus pseudalcaliphilus TaxID=79884 RepID=UPI00064D9E29|nr:ABC transporter ATP-binding protein [Alkalihalobacillus pseudalcaliphilus]KMK76543.1 multidrug ABC transporter permease [Alkalihalobacillus pseudalcaliphilus]
MEKLNIKEFFRIIRSYYPSKKITITAICLVLFQTCLSLALPLFTMNFIDEMDIEGLSLATILLVGCLFILQLICSAFAIYMMIFIGEKIVFSLRNNTWERLVDLPIKFFDENSTGKLMSRITNDTLVIKNFITSQLIPFFSGVISVIGAIILLFIIDWKMTLLMMTVVPVLMLVMIPLGKQMYKVSRALQDETASFQGDLGRVLSDIRLVKLSLAENQEKEVGNSRMKKLFNYGLKEGKISAVVQPISMSALLLILVVVFGYGSLRVSNGTLSAGALVAIIFYLFQISNPLAQLSSFFTEMQKALGATERLNYILSQAKEPITKESSENKLYSENDSLIFHKLKFGYNQNEEILKEIDLEVKIGQMTAIIGPSGSGKTTLFSLIERFYNPTDGFITYKNQDIQTIPLNQWREKIAYVSQESPIMSGSILSNLTYGLSTYSIDKVNLALKDANLEEFINKLPKGLQTEVGERGIKLSGGQRQRLAIARAMIRNPEILLLDEATAHLDGASEKLVQKAMDVLMEGRTTIVIAHRLSTVLHSEQLIFLENGKITGRGTHFELMSEHKLYNELVSQQTEFNHLVSHP